MPVLPPPPQPDSATASDAAIAKNTDDFFADHHFCPFHRLLAKETRVSTLQGCVVKHVIKENHVFHTCFMRMSPSEPI